MGKRQLRLEFFILGTNILRPLVTERTQITFRGQIPNPDKPLLWLPQHQAWDDILNLEEGWPEVGYPRLKVIARDNYFPNSPLMSHLAKKAMQASGIFHIIYKKVDQEKEKLDQEKRRFHLIPRRRLDERERKKLNEEAINALLDGSSRGFHSVILPEGTTKGNGRISPIRPGCYEIAKTGIPCIALGNTYDFMSGNRGPIGRRNLVFLNFGLVFKHKPLERNEGETNEDYVERDKNNFLETIRSQYLDLNTITVSQLGSLYLLERLRGDRSVSFENLRETILSQADRLRSLEGIIIDKSLTDQNGGEKNIQDLYSFLIRGGYIQLEKGRPHINSERTLYEPEIDVFRKENPVLYTANKIIEVVKERPEIRAQLDYYIKVA